VNPASGTLKVILRKNKLRDIRFHELRHSCASLLLAKGIQMKMIYGQQLGIGGDLSMKYYVMGYAPEFNSKGLYMEFSHNGVKTKVYADEPNADGFYVFILEGINPQCMGDNIYAMLCYNETEVARHGYEKGKEYSVEKNLLNLLEKYKDDAALVALINDTLAYRSIKQKRAEKSARHKLF